MEKKLSNKTLRLTESAILIAVAVILNEFTVFKFPFGGSITFLSQLPIVVLGYRYGVKWGFISGATMGLMNMMFNLAYFSYVTGIGSYIILVFSDYLIAFGVLGFAGGLFRNKIQNQMFGLTLGAFIASLLRYICHFISGITIWKGYAPSEALKAVLVYSLSYNGSFMIPEAVITVIGALIVGRILNLKSTNVTIKK